MLDICQQLQDYGYDFNDVTSHWADISSYNVWEITWATQELLLDHKEVSGCFVLLCRCNCCIVICLSGFILKYVRGIRAVVKVVDSHLCGRGSLPG